MGKIDNILQAVRKQINIDPVRSYPVGSPIVKPEDPNWLWRVVLEIDYTATGAIVPFFSINNIGPIPYQVVRLKTLRVNQECSTAAASFFGSLVQGVQVRFDQDSQIFDVISGTVGGASSPGTTLGTFPTMRVTVPAEQNGVVIGDLGYYIYQRSIAQINVSILGAIATAIPNGPLVALGDSIRIRLEMGFEVIVP